VSRTATRLNLVQDSYPSGRMLRGFLKGLPGRQVR